MRRVVAWLLLALLVTAAAWSGIWLRHALWNITMDTKPSSGFLELRALRFNGDIDNGFNWGKRADHLGYFNVYDELGTPERGKELVDYGPLRLGVMSAWVQWLKPRFPNLSRRDKSEYFHAPLLWFNTAMEAATALAAWLVTTHLVRRQKLSVGPNLTKPQALSPKPLFLGFIAALLVWFNPIILWNAHAWPQWDIWPMPFFLLAVYCGCRRWWLGAGLLIGTASLLKGQIFMIAWTLPLWALCLGDWRGFLRFIVGALCAVAVGGCVWELSIYLPGPHGFDRATAGHQQIRRLNWPATLWAGSWLLFALLLPRRFSITAVCAALGVSLFSTMWLFGGSQHWLESGYEIGTWHYPFMYVGSTSNLPAILQRYGYGDINYVCFTVNLPKLLQSLFGGPQWGVTMRTLLLLIYFTLCAFCAVFAAVNDRRRDPRLAIAICLPWLLFFTISTQIHERYLLFFSACAATFVCAGWNFALLAGAVTLVGLGTTLHQVFLANGIPRGNGNAAQWKFYPTLHAIVAGTHPGIAWLLLLAAAIFLYSIVPSSPRKEQV